MTETIHIQKAEHDLVPIDALRVLVDGSDSEGWMAQCLEIDYFVCAKTEQSVKENFVKGLAKTVGPYLEEDGNMNDLLKPAPKEVWEEFSQAMSKEKNPFPSASVSFRSIVLSSTRWLSSSPRNRKLSYNNPNVLER